MSGNNDVNVPFCVEHNCLGPVNVPADKLWGAQTRRSLEHFRATRRTQRWPIGGSFDMELRLAYAPIA